MVKPNLRQYKFSDVDIGLNGVIYKAGLRSTTAANVDGQGLGYDGLDWYSESGGTWDVDSTNGTKKTSSESDQNRAEISLPAAIQVPMATRGAYQIEILLSNWIVGTASNNFLRLTSTDGLGNGIALKSLYAAEGSDTTYRRKVDDMNGVSGFGSSVGFLGNSACVDNVHGAVPGVVVHANTETDADGFFKLGVSWDSAKYYIFINGVLCATHWRGSTAGILTASDFLKLEMQRQSACYTRNLIIWDRPFQEANKGQVRVVGITHSFGVRDRYGSYTDRRGAAYSQDAYGMVETLSGRLFNDLSFSIDLRMWAESSTKMVDFYDKIQGDVADAYASGTGTAFTPFSRHRPHFCILYGPMYNGGYTGTAVDTTTFANHATGIHTITDIVMKAGCIPIWIVEQNDDSGTAPTDYSTSIYAAVIAELQRQQAVNDIGIVDMYTASGGATVDQTFVQGGGSDSGLIHPSGKSQNVCGGLLAAEMERLKASPPKYSRLSGSTEYVPIVIAAP